MSKYTASKAFGSFHGKVIIQEYEGNKFVGIAIGKPLDSPPIPKDQVKVTVYDKNGRKVKLTTLPSGEYLHEIGSTASLNFGISAPIDSLTKVQLEISGESQTLALADTDPDYRPPPYPIPDPFGSSSKSSRRKS